MSGAFHTNLMYPAREPLQNILKTVEIHKPIISVHSNVTSHQYRKSDSIPKLLVEQICKPVKWEQILQVLYSRRDGEGFPQTFEMGPGKQLGTLLKMTNAKAYKSYKAVNV